MTSSITPRTQDSSLTSSTSPVKKNGISGFFESVKNTTIRIFKFCCSSIAQLPQQAFTFIKNFYNAIVKRMQNPETPSNTSVHQGREIGVNAKDKNGMTPLMKAVQKGDIIKVGKLLRCKGIDVNVKNDEGETALICASKVEGENKDVTKCIAALVKREDIDIAITDNNGKTALMHLSGLLNIEGTRLLVESKKDIGINKQDNGGDTALVAVASFSESAATDVIELLLKREDIDPTLTNQYGKTALMNRICSRGDDRCFELLVKRSKDCIDTINTAGQTALMMAAENRPNYVELLLAVPGINPDIKDEDDMTALDLAKKRCRRIEDPDRKATYEKAIKLLEQFMEQRRKQKTNNSG